MKRHNQMKMLKRWKLITECVFVAFVISPACNRISAGNEPACRNLQIEINSPYACYNEVKLDSTWSGTSILAFRNAEGKKTLKEKKNFYVNTNEDKQKVLRLLVKIESRPPVFSGRGFDEYHFILNIDGKRYVDKYGEDTLISEMLTDLLPYVQMEDSGQCDYFQLLRQTLNRPVR